MAVLDVHPDLKDLASGQVDYLDLLEEFRAALEDEHPAPSAQLIVQAAVQLGVLLLRKNAAYGNSALNPVGVFSKDLSTVDKINIRMDDKLSRLKNGSAAGEDVEWDLAGYLILKRVAQALALTT